MQNSQDANCQRMQISSDTLWLWARVANIICGQGLPRSSWRTLCFSSGVWLNWTIFVPICKITSVHRSFDTLSLWARVAQSQLVDSLPPEGCVTELLNVFVSKCKIYLIQIEKCIYCVTHQGCEQWLPAVTVGKGCPDPVDGLFASRARVVWPGWLHSIRRVSDTVSERGGGDEVSSPLPCFPPPPLQLLRGIEAATWWGGEGPAHSADQWKRRSEWRCIQPVPSFPVFHRGRMAKSTEAPHW